MYQVDISNKTMRKLNTPTFAELNLRERYDIQEWIDTNPDILGEELRIIGKEVVVGNGIRLDLLAIDINANLVIIELKRDNSGNNVDWQAIKYASHCSAFSDEYIFTIYQEYLNNKSIQKSAKTEIENFIGKIGKGIEHLNQEQRIVLVSREFHPDVASAVLWLNEKGLDITCIKINPFTMDDGKLLIYPNKIIPLPEAEEYVKRKAIQKQENIIQQSNLDLISFDVPEYTNNELSSKLADFLSKQNNLTERFIAFLEILLSEDRDFDREEIKDLLFHRYNIGNDVQHAGRLLSNISQAITRKSNDFLRQLISFGRNSDTPGAYKNSYYIDKQYRDLILNTISQIR